MTYIHHLKITAGLDPDAAIVRHTVKESDRVQAEQIFRSLGLKQGRTVFVSPQANSCPSLDARFCRRLCDRIHKKGYDVFMNLAGSANDVPAAGTVFLPLSTVSPFCNLCGYGIVLRSGICEIISGSAAQFHILYPDRRFQGVFPVREFMASGRIWEYRMDENKPDEIVDAILDNLQKDELIRPECSGERVKQNETSV
jgi:hypothetical protein